MFLRNQLVPSLPSVSREEFCMPSFVDEFPSGPAVTIDQSLTKLFQCMTLAYRLKSDQF